MEYDALGTDTGTALNAGRNAAKNYASTGDARNDACSNAPGNVVRGNPCAPGNEAGSTAGICPFNYLFK